MRVVDLKNANQAVSKQSEPALRRDAFIKAMRSIVHTVAVVTTDGQAGRFGATINAFSSVSADPPSLLICLRASSRILQAVSGNKEFCLNVLAQGDDLISKRFAGLDDDKIANRFDGIACLPTPDFNSPMLASANAFACQVRQIVHAHSHDVVFADVMAVHASHSKTPLTYVNGAYQSSN